MYFFPLFLKHLNRLKTELCKKAETVQMTWKGRHHEQTLLFHSV